MIYVRQPTEIEHRELKRMTQQAVGRVSQRAQMVLLSAQGRTVPEISRIFDLSQKGVRFWLRRFDAAGPAGLYDEPRSGRPPKVTQQIEATLVNWLQGDPQNVGGLATFWSVAMLALALAEQLMVKLSPSSIRATLQRLDLRWGRPRLSMPKRVDPAKAAKQWAIAQAVMAAGPEAAILYGDASRIHLLPLIRAMWHWVGQQIRIPTPGTNVTRALFGALNIRTGHWSYLIREKMHKEDFLAFLDYLLLQYPTGPIILVVDNYTSHTAHVVAAWLAVHPRLQLFYLPKYCSHLNPVEPIWLRLKDKIAANRLYASMPLLLDTVERCFLDMTPRLALTWADVLNVPDTL
ncbi:MAG: IS630 family transposase [Chloroflexi bacterium]|nr:IS630 family transposase [Chloroflexota bacterium]